MKSRKSTEDELNGRRLRHGLAACAIVLGMAIVGALAGPLWFRTALAQEVDLEKIFWCDPARTGGETAAQCAGTRALVLGNCTACHTFVPIVKAQKSADEWLATMAAHRDRVPDVADDQYGQIQKYLAVRFNPENPPPQLPPELEALGTGQAN